MLSECNIDTDGEYPYEPVDDRDGQLQCVRALEDSENLVTPNDEVVDQHGMFDDGDGAFETGKCFEAGKSESSSFRGRLRAKPSSHSREQKSRRTAH